MTSQIQSAFADKTVISREDLKLFYRSVNPDIKDQSFDWLIYHLCHGKIIRRVARNSFILYNDDYALAEYRAGFSGEAEHIINRLSDRYPLLSFSVWETVQLNEFVNHQMGRNCIFVEAEKPLEQSVFEALREEFALPVLYKPSKNDLYLYAGQTTITVLPLTSEAPVREHRATIEKILADLYANALVGGIVSPSEYLTVFDEALSKYIVNQNALLRYARRRGKADEIKGILETVVRRGNEAIHD
jgi:hypothetical protein